MVVVLVGVGLGVVLSTPANNDGSTTTTTTTTTASTTTTNKEDNHDHVYFLVITVAPSCGVEGKQAYVCDICGKKQCETSIDALQHNYKYSSELSIAPTCTTSGKKVEHCYNCGQNKEELWAATGHEWHTKSSCDSTTNELVITPYCTRCPLVSQNTYRYKVNDVTKLTSGSHNIFGELDYTIHGDKGNATILKAPYYAVYCNATYLLIARSAKSIAGYEPDGAVNSSPLNYYISRGCTIVYEADIYIDEYGTIKTMPIN